MRQPVVAPCPYKHEAVTKQLLSCRCLQHDHWASPLAAATAGPGCGQPAVVATCSPARDAGAGYTAWGHSSIYGPFAEEIATTEEKPGTVFAELDYSELEQRRKNMPLTQQKRWDLYSLVDKTLQN